LRLTLRFICIKQERHGSVQNFIDSLGNFTNYQNFIQVGDYHRKVAPVKHANGYWMLVDKAGLPLSEPVYEHISPKPNEQGFLGVAVSSHVGIADREGKLVLPCTLEKIEEVGKGIYRVMQGDAIGYWRKNGTWLWPLQK